MVAERDLLDLLHQFLLLGSHRHTLEDAVVTAADSTTLISGKVDILGNFGVINIEEACDAVNGGSHIINRKLHGSLCDDMAGSVTDENLHCDARVSLGFICQVDERPGNAVGNLIGMCRIYFFKHNQPFPFLARSNRSITSSWGFAPLYSPVQFSRTIW